MPHLLHSAIELNQLYPAIEAPPDEPLDDLQQDAQDGVYQHGLRIAEHIRQQTEAEGRRRHPGAGGGVGETDQTSGGHGGEQRIGAVMWPALERIMNSTFSPRRSGKISHTHYDQYSNSCVIDPDIPDANQLSPDISAIDKFSFLKLIVV